MLALLWAQVESMAVFQVCVLFTFYCFNQKVISFLLENPLGCLIEQHWQVKVTFCPNEQRGWGRGEGSICPNVLTCCSILMTCGMTKTRTSRQIQWNRVSVEVENPVQVENPKESLGQIANSGQFL